MKNQGKLSCRGFEKEQQSMIFFDNAPRTNCAGSWLRLTTELLLTTHGRLQLSSATCGPPARRGDGDVAAGDSQ